MLSPKKRSADLMQAVMERLVGVFPGCAVAVLVAPFDAPKDARVNWVSNGKREDMLVMMKELIARFEGRVQDTPEAPQ